jgi:hypothetical protein
MEKSARKRRQSAATAANDSGTEAAVTGGRARRRATVAVAASARSGIGGGVDEKGSVATSVRAPAGAGDDEIAPIPSKSRRVSEGVKKRKGSLEPPSAAKRVKKSSEYLDALKDMIQGTSGPSSTSSKPAKADAEDEEYGGLYSASAVSSTSNYNSPVSHKFNTCRDNMLRDQYIAATSEPSRVSSSFSSGVSDIGKVNNIPTITPYIPVRSNDRSQGSMSSALPGRPFSLTSVLQTADGVNSDKESSQLRAVTESWEPGLSTLDNVGLRGNVSVLPLRSPSISEIPSGVSDDGIATSALAYSQRHGLISYLQNILIHVGLAAIAAGCVLLYLQMKFSDGPLAGQTFKFAAPFGYFFLVTGLSAVLFVVSEDSTANVVLLRSVYFDVSWVTIARLTKQLGHSLYHLAMYAFSSTMAASYEQEVVQPTVNEETSSGGLFSANKLYYFTGLVGIITVRSWLLSSLSFVMANRGAIVRWMLSLVLTSLLSYFCFLYKRSQSVTEKIIDVAVDEVMEILKAGDNEVGTPVDFIKEEIAETLSKISRRCMNQRIVANSEVRTNGTEMAGSEPELSAVNTLVTSLPDSWLSYLRQKENIRSKIWPTIVKVVQQDQRVRKFDREYYGEKRTVWRRLDCRNSTPLSIKGRGFKDPADETNAVHPVPATAAAPTSAPVSTPLLSVPGIPAYLQFNNLPAEPRCQRTSTPSRIPALRR